jgi:hypothetical protein
MLSAHAHGSWHAPICAFALSLLLSFAFDASAAVPLDPRQFRLAGLSLGGSLDYEYFRVEPPSGEGLQRDNLTLDFRSRATGYYWQPWLATWYADLNLISALGNPWLGEDTRLGSQSAGVSGDQSELGILLGLDLFPASRFPLNLSFDHREVKRDDPLLAGEGYSQTILRANSSYTRTPMDRYAGRLELFRRDDSALPGEGVRVNANLDAFFNPSDRQALEARGFFSHEESEGSSTDPDGDSRTTATLDLRQRYVPLVNLTFDNFATLTHFEDDDTQVDTADASSIFQWRARNRPLNVNGRASLAHQSFTTPGREDRLSRASVDASAFYVYSPTTELNASTSNTINQFNSDSATTASREDDTEYTGLHRAGIIYRRPNDTWYGFRRSRTLSGAALVEILPSENEEDDASLLGLASQTLDRSIRLFTLTHAYTNETVLGSRVDTIDGFVPEFAFYNRLTSSWARVFPWASMAANASFSDSRRYLLKSNLSSRSQNDEVEETRFDFFVQGQRSFQRDAELSVRYSLRTELDQSLNQDDWEKDANITTTYRHRNIFGVPRLEFRSSLVARAYDDVFPDFGSSEDNELTWENDLNYFIGRLEVEFELDATRVDSEQTFTFFVGLTRYFGR